MRTGSRRRVGPPSSVQPTSSGEFGACKLAGRRKLAERTLHERTSCCGRRVCECSLVTCVMFANAVLSRASCLRMQSCHVRHVCECSLVTCVMFANAVLSRASCLRMQSGHVCRVICYPSVCICTNAFVCYSEVYVVCIYAYIWTGITSTVIHTYIHTCINTYIRTRMSTYASYKYIVRHTYTHT
jgi:hypothetical protein